MGYCYTFRWREEATILKLFCTPSEKGITLKGINVLPSYFKIASEKACTLNENNLFPFGASSFLLGEIIFQ